MPACVMAFVAALALTPAALVAQQAPAHAPPPLAPRQPAPSPPPRRASQPPAPRRIPRPPPSHAPPRPRPGWRSRAARGVAACGRPSSRRHAPAAADAHGAPQGAHGEAAGHGGEEHHGESPLALRVAHRQLPHPGRRHSVTSCASRSPITSPIAASRFAPTWSPRRRPAPPRPRSSPRSTRSCRRCPARSRR